MMKKILIAVAVAAFVASSIYISLVLMPSNLASNKNESRKEYQPVLTDEQIEQKIRALPQVTDVKLIFNDTFENGKSYYVGLTYTDDTTIRHAADVGDQAIAITMQGKHVGSGSITPTTFIKGQQIEPGFLGIEYSYYWRIDRYGKQPGSGKVPANAPRLQLSKSANTFEKYGIAVGE